MEYLTNNWKVLLDAAAYGLAGLTIVTMGVAKATTKFKGDDKVAGWMAKAYKFISRYVNAPLELPSSSEE